MSYDLYIGDQTFSSWSLRGWLMFEAFNIPFRTHLAGLYSGTLKEDLAELAPARFVPVMKTPDGVPVGDTLAMAETLAERHPDAGLWPEDPAARALARWLVAEMHSGFGALRGDCPMQLLGVVEGFEPSESVLADLTRIEELWSIARAKFGRDNSPWLFGDYSLADVFYAPVAARIAGFSLPVSADAQAYVAAHLADPAFRRWRAMGLLKSYDPVPYIDGLPLSDWPGPAPLVAVACSGPSINDACPYSGDPVTDYLKLNGQVWGFCNPGCRDKTVNDPEAWPAFMAMVSAQLGTGRD
ncbi:glutathione S-transferase [Aliiroseovarius sp. S1123]|jgi:glutathione S-transferase|uniref:glutathione S-transferase n=1 Tax=unclassified Aliiroseovarius TaxID=2623558 RepID=UPI001FF41E1F|nr:glutathione S-transferase [Aliiroseovarius sp. S1123]MCK0169470.1 glutathione S-transferase [Aliiroseovarius sp. S1123]